jgi:hypothetical protein
MVQLESSAESHSGSGCAGKAFAGRAAYKVAMLADALYFEAQSLTQPLFFPK